MLEVVWKERKALRKSELLRCPDNLYHGLIEKTMPDTNAAEIMAYLT